MVEHCPFKAGVLGSSPSRLTVLPQGRRLSPQTPSRKAKCPITGHPRFDSVPERSGWTAPTPVAGCRGATGTPAGRVGATIISSMLVRTLVAVLALAGLADAFYFTFAYYGRIKKARWVPEILCAREGSNCVTVVQTPYARVFGVPNSLLGVVYYLLLILWAVAAPRVSAVGWTLIAASAGTVVLGTYLVYSLRRKLYIDCPLCYAAHAINAILLVLLVLARRS